MKTKGEKIVYLILGIMGLIFLTTITLWGIAIFGMQEEYF